MKRILIMLALVLGHWSVAQVEVVEKNYPYNGHELDIDVDLATKIQVEAWDKVEIAVKISYAVNNGNDNDAVTVDIDDYKDRLSIDVKVSDRKMNRSDYCCCEDGKGTYWNGDSRSRSCIEMVVTVKIPAQADIRIKSVISDVFIEGMSSNIDVETVTGLIDLDWDESTGADVNLKTTTGDLYTNINLQKKKDRGLALISSHDVKGRLKGGEKEVYLKTVTSDIYFRKQGT